MPANVRLQAHHEVATAQIALITASQPPPVRLRMRGTQADPRARRLRRRQAWMGWRWQYRPGVRWMRRSPACRSRAVRPLRLAVRVLGVGVSAAETAAGGAHGFPAALTSFIGRDGPVREVAGLLERHRLVTLTGPGGVGKTRLAAEVARQVPGRFADGAWQAELAPVQDRCRSRRWWP